MESQNTGTTNPNMPSKPEKTSANRSGRAIAGLIVVAVGAVLLAREMGYYFPHWLFSWKTLLIALGLFLGFRHAFNGLAWLILILTGTVFLLDDIYPFADISDFAWPIIIIGIGLYMIFRPGRGSSGSHHQRGSWGHGTSITSNDDYLDSVSIFGGIRKNIISKNFKGGDATTFFGGTELNLSQADIQGQVELELTQVFGGTKLIVPSHWKIKSEDLVTIFGGLDDKRIIPAEVSPDPNKVLVIKGTILFGGIDIKSF